MLTTPETNVVHPNVAGIIVGQHKFREFNSDDIWIFRKCLADGEIKGDVIQTSASFVSNSLRPMPHSTLIVTTHGNWVEHWGEITVDMNKTVTRVESHKIVTRVTQLGMDDT